MENESTKTTKSDTTLRCGETSFLKVLAVSDFHGSVDAAHKTINKVKAVDADVIVICGDITHFGSVKDAQRIIEPLTALRLPVLYVPGNCDPSELAEAEISGAICLQGRCYTQSNVAFIGVGGAQTSPFYSWFELSETQIMNVLEQGAERCSRNKWLAVVTHTPPKDTRVDLAWSNVHAGSASLRRFIEAKKPHIVFCAHIHEARGIDHIGDTIIVNPGPVRHGNCAVAHFDDEVEVKLDSL